LSVDASTTNGSLSGVNYLNPGMCVIDANQAGDAEYLAAPRVQQSVLVSPVPPDIAVGAKGLDGALWVQVSQFSAGGFSQLSGGWLSLGGQIIAAPAVAAVPQTSGVKPNSGGTGKKCYGIRVEMPNPVAIGRRAKRMVSALLSN
jgi:hypothetical protein